MAHPLTVLTRNRDFRRLFLAELVMFGGDWFVMVPLLVLLPRLTGGGLLGGLVLAADTGVSALLLPYAGTVADRLDRRKILVTANLSAIVAVCGLLFVHDARTAWLAPVSVGAMAVAKAFYSPTANAAIPNLVGRADLSAANAIAGSAWGTMTVVGASLGGMLVEVFPPRVCFLITAVTLAVAAALGASIRRPLQQPRDPRAVPPRPLAAIREALRYVRRDNRVACLVTVKSAVGLGNGVLVVYPVLATELLRVGGFGTGLLFAARGAGALVGPLLLRSVLRRRGWLLPGLAVSMAGYGVAYLGVSVVAWFPAVLALIAVAHVAGGGNWAMSNAALQMEVPDALRGRVFATDIMLATLAVSTSQLLVGLLVDRVDPRILIAACGAVTLLYSVGWRLVTSRLVRTAPAPVVEPTVAPAVAPASRTAAGGMPTIGGLAVPEPATDG